jgi:hypothetical protein
MTPFANGDIDYHAYRQEAEDAIHKLDLWIEDNGWAGFDPYDILGTSLFLYMQRAKANSPVRIFRRILFSMEYRYPLLTRNLFAVLPQVNSKAMALFARGYLALFETTGEDIFREKSITCLEWLLENSSSYYSGFSWGYPFDWQSVIFIPKNTPSVVVSSIAGDAFWNAYRLLGERKYLDVCMGVCEFITKDLNVDEIDSDTLCFSYTPLDDFHVHNSNLFAAEFLTRIGKEQNVAEWFRLGIKAANYALSEQNEDGSIFYWGNIQSRNSPNHIDHYHSGFEIRALLGIWNNTDDLRYCLAADRYYRFYRNHLLQPTTDGLQMPKMNPEEIYPINIHSCAESILCNLTAAQIHNKAYDMAVELTIWTIRNMQNKDGSFAYKIDKNRKFHRIDIPYLRWGQAWMINALGQLSLSIKEKK